MKLNKIFTFKNIMFVLCVGIAIISTFFSCEVRAYTNEDVSDFVNQLLVNQNIDSNTRSWLGTFKNNENALFNYMNNNGLNLANYKGFSVEMYANSSFYFYLIPHTTNANYSNNNYSIQPCDYIYRDRYGNFSKTTNYNYAKIIATNGAGYYSYFGLTDGLFDNIHPFGNNNYFENYFTPTILFDYTPVISVASGDFTYIKINYVSNFIPLGVLGNNEYYQLDARFRDNLQMKNLFNWSDVPGTRVNIF